MLATPSLGYLPSARRQDIFALSAIRALLSAVHRLLLVQLLQ
jgi:hypothetical protein